MSPASAVATLMLRDAAKAHGFMVSPLTFRVMESAACLVRLRFVEHLLVPSRAVLNVVRREVFRGKAGVELLRWTRRPDLVERHAFGDHLAKAGVNRRDGIAPGDHIGSL